MKKLIGIMATLCLVAGLASAQAVVSALNDTSVAFQVLNGYTGTLTIVVSGTGASGSVMTNVVTCDGNATTLVVTNGGTTMAQLESRIGACTNAAGKAQLTINSEPSLAADTIAELAGTYTAVAGKWLSVLWDTSACLHYDLYFPSNKVPGVPGVGAVGIASISGYPAGTGTVTVAVYQKGVLLTQHVYTSPVYVPGVGGSTNVYTAVDDVNIDWPIHLRKNVDQAVIVRASRATAINTGGVLSGFTE